MKKRSCVCYGAYEIWSNHAYCDQVTSWKFRVKFYYDSCSIMEFQRSTKGWLPIERYLKGSQDLFIPSETERHSCSHILMSPRGNRWWRVYGYLLKSNGNRYSQNWTFSLENPCIDRLNLRKCSVKNLFVIIIMEWMPTYNCISFEFGRVTFRLKSGKIRSRTMYCL